MRVSRWKKAASYLMLVFLAVLNDASAVEDDVKLSLDKLFSLKVTSVSGTAMDLKKSPAAIYVITSDDFKKQGHRTIASALRAVPGFHVKQIDSSRFAISARGGAARFANKLLVLIDGRSVYTPLFSGVYWELQDMPLEDIARIEVIRGPGATLWGANAVNGVINIVTKDVRDTQGGYVKFGIGNVDPYEAEFRYGDQATDNVFYKIWGKQFSRGESERQDGTDFQDSWDGGHFGIKVDWYATPLDTHSFQVNYSNLTLGSESDYVTPLGSIFLADPIGPSFPIPAGTPTYNSFTERYDADWETANFLWSWTKNLSANSGWTFKTYFDYTDQVAPHSGEERKTFDVDFRNWFNINEHNSFIWGVSFRTTKDKFINDDTIFLTPDNRRASTVSGFIQNTTKLSTDLSLMYGTKLGHNDYTGLEIQPSVRLSYDYSTDTTLWASWSRAVRTPSRIEDDVTLRQSIFTVPFGPDLGESVVTTIIGNRDMDSEELLAYELGARTHFFNKKLTVDLAVFYNDYSNRLTIEEVPGEYMTREFSSSTNAQAYGAELSLKYKATDDLDFLLNYTWFQLDDVSQTVSDPEHVLFAGMNYKILKNLSWHTTAYYMGNVVNDDLGRAPNTDVRPFLNVDTGVIWNVTPKLDLSLWVKNLTDPQHQEGDTNQGNTVYEIPRSVLFQATYKF